MCHFLEGISAECHHSANRLPHSQAPRTVAWCLRALDVSLEPLTLGVLSSSANLSPCGDCLLLLAGQRADSPFSLLPYALFPGPPSQGVRCKAPALPRCLESAAFQCLLFMNGKQFRLQNIKWLGQLWKAEPLIRRHLLLM